jgi:hypothetical protein
MENKITSIIEVATKELYDIEKLKITLNDVPKKQF